MNFYFRIKSYWHLFTLSVFILILLPYSGNSQVTKSEPAIAEFNIEWESGNPSGEIEVINGDLKKITLLTGKGKVSKNIFSFSSSGPPGLRVQISGIHLEAGPGATLIRVNTRQNPFTFFLRDVSGQFPIIIPAYRVCVSKSTDHRSYNLILEDVRNRHLKKDLEKINDNPENSFENAASAAREQYVPTLLGISRDIRIFEISQATNIHPAEGDLITPRFASRDETLNDNENRPVNYFYCVGRGQGINDDIHRYLEEGSLPILHSVLKDNDITYHSAYFVTLERSPLNQNSVTGTNYLVADYNSEGHTFTREQEAQLVPLLQQEKNKAEETVLFFRCVAKNEGNVPRYAWFKSPKPGRGWWEKLSYRFDSSSGFSSYDSGMVFSITTLNDRPVANEEIAILIPPGDSAVFQFLIPHSPVSQERAHHLVAQSFLQRHNECIAYWNDKLNRAAGIQVPEKRIEEMIKAGLLHLDMITYGEEPGGTLAPCIGVYSPIGTESSPIIQFYASMGLEDQAKRSLMYFLDKQHDDGLIQNFGGYMIETGAALWSMGEYYRYTRDTLWVKNNETRLLKSCQYLINWRNQNKIDSLRGSGYGMISGKVADPNDPFHQFMLNGYGYLGLARTAEMLSKIDPEKSGMLSEEARSWKKNIRESFLNSMAHSPVVPLGDGTWCPTAPPWTEAEGPRSLYLKPETFFSHGTFTVPDALLGPLYLVFCEVIDPHEISAKFMMDYHSELFFENNAAFSQPYYSRHNWLQLKLGMVKPFLTTYYNTMAALADRETYSFWEHVYHVSPHKTHEEAWFLMQTRWMLYLEEGDTLSLLKGIPRAWMQDGKSIKLNKVASYFGPVSLDVESHLSKRFIEATVLCDTERKPETVIIRLPNPDGKVPVKITGGEYDPDNESVTIKNFNGSASVKVEY